MPHPAPRFNPPTVPFAHAPAQACSCCSKPLSTGSGYAVPYIGIVGPKCVHKFTALAQALAQIDGLTLTRDDGAEAHAAAHRLIFTLRLKIGYEVQILSNADGSKTLKIGARTRKHARVCVTWEERRAEFERDLKLASARPAGQVAA